MRLKKMSPSRCSVLEMRRDTAGEETCSILAAPLMEPVSMVARKTSIWRKVQAQVG